MVKEEIYNIVNSFFTGHDYRVLAYYYVGDTDRVEVDDNGEVSIYSTNPVFHVDLDKPFSLKNKKVKNEYDKLCNTIYIKFNGTLLTFEYNKELANILTL